MRRFDEIPAQARQMKILFVFLLTLFGGYAIIPGQWMGMAWQK
jgi:hypothetical protein